jgi:MoxR-like ATPase
MKPTVSACLDALSGIILGKEDQLKLALACLLARGHLLIEDLPGMGKTTLSHGLAHIMGLSYRRIQFTSDLLPADIIGATIFEQLPGQSRGRFTFHPGPVFSQVLLADEINRATPKAQSALLEAMEERQVSVDGESHPLPTPFFVIATQNPLSQAGTFPLPESQLDRFLMRIQLGYPSQVAEKELLSGQSRRDLLESLPRVISEQALEQLQTEVFAVKVSDSVLDYLLRLVHYTRYEAGLAYGLSPRGALAWLTAAKSWAYIHNRTHLLPEDLQKVASSVVDHRLEAAGQGKGQAWSEVMIRSVPVLAHG